MKKVKCVVAHSIDEMKYAIKKQHISAYQCKEHGFVHRKQEKVHHGYNKKLT